jgi:flagellar hook-associated protein 2
VLLASGKPGSQNSKKEVHMGGGFSIGGLISGLDSNSIIAQFIQIERQPLERIQERISGLETQRTALRDLRSTLQTLRNRAQDFRFNVVFDKYGATSTDDKVATATVGENPVLGSYSVEVLTLASATEAVGSASLGAAIDPNVALNSSGLPSEVTAGTFTLNGVAFTVDPATQSLNDLLGQINSSGAGVTATYDVASDKMTFENTAAGDTSLINFGAESDDTNFLSLLNVRQATQSTNVSGSTTVTSTRNLGSVSTSEKLDQVNFRNGVVSAGNFRINGVAIDVDPTTDSIADVIGRINSSDAQVTASYDSATDSIRMVSKVLGSRTINFQSGTSNFLDVANLTTSTQTAGVDAQFTVNGGATQTRNTNAVSDAIGGMTLNMTSVGTTTINISNDDDAIVEQIQSFVDAFNAAVSKVNELTQNSGALKGDGGIRSIESYLRSNVFSNISGISGEFASLAHIGISTGDSFDAGAVSQLSFDREAFLEAYNDDSDNVQNLFHNDSDTGVADIFFSYLDEVTKTTGFLNARVKSNGTLDQQIRTYEDQMDRLEERLSRREERLRQQFGRLEQLSAGFQSQNSALSGLSSGLRSF